MTAVNVLQNKATLIIDLEYGSHLMKQELDEKIVK